MAKLKRVSRGLTFVFASTLVFGIAAANVMEANAGTLDGFFGTHSTKLVQKGEGELFNTFTPDEELLTDGKGDSAKLVKAHEDLAKEIQGEGTVLLKNDGTLPLNTSNDNKCKVSLFGIRSSATITGAFIGHKAAGNNQTVHFRDALKEAGFSVNETLADAYDAYCSDNKILENDYPPQGAYATYAGGNGFNPKEATIDDLLTRDSAAEDSILEYNDAGIVVIGRAATEGVDWTKDQVDPAAGMDNPMQLSTNEKNIIEYAKSKCKKVIVIVNAVNQMEIDDLKQDEGIDAILWMGIGGNYGTRAVAEILNGSTNPSGHLPDTYASYSLSAPATINMGEYKYSNDASEFAKRLKSSASGQYYVIEAEGIYTGYHYYETRYADAIANKGNANSTAGSSYEGNWDYDKEVSYPFGYGLSYTTFSEEFVGEPKITHKAHEFKMEFEVKVTNTGSKAGKHVVQIYGQAPYTEENIANGVEKSAIQLLAYDKTALLDPDQSVTLTIEVDMQNIASWDSLAKGGEGSYILDGGDYYFSIGNGAHEAVNNILARQGYSSANGEPSKAYLYNYDVSETDSDTFNVTKAGVQVKNNLSGADFNTYQENAVTYLSRNDWSGTWPKEYKGLEATPEMIQIINGMMYEPSTNDDVSLIKFDQEGDLNYVNLKGADYDYQDWSSLLDQLNLEDALNFIVHGNRDFLAMDSVGFLGGKFTENGPNGVGDQAFQTISYNNFGDNVSECPWHISEDDPNAKYEMRVFTSGPVLAATFSHELAYEEGRLIGNDALFVGLPILWGPSMNTHRNGYNGRNIEYYSEDAILTGNTGMEYSIGALDKGLIAAPKHFAFNDQETHRDGVAPYLNEQRAREIELRAFQIAFEADKYDTEEKDVGLLGVMTSFSKIGPCEVTCSEGLLTNILREEWGYNGYIVSDLNDDEDYLPQALAAGITSFDSKDTINDISGFDIEDVKHDKKILNNVKEAVHRNLWVITQSNYMNTVNANTEIVSNMTWWRAAYIAIISASATVVLLGAAGTVVFTVLENKKKGAK